MALSHDLTESQWEAVNHFEGPLLVLAGPGSGKTRVITRRIARLIEQGVQPREILAITFTNKAAREMAERVAALLPGNRVWVSTFHRFCASLLRKHAEAVGLQRNYTIYDSADQKQLIRQVMSDLDFDSAHYPPGSIASQISLAKNRLQSAEEFSRSVDERHGNPFEKAAARVYTGYQKALLASNAVDFDDLLLHVANLLQDNAELRRKYDAWFRFILVDEYQDTNIAQYRIVAAMSQDHPNLCATGDPDQSIYGWRGAQIDNILRFESDYPKARLVRLEQNFRSTQSILRAADSLIAHNIHRKQKSLITSNPLGAPVELQVLADANAEAESIARQIRNDVLAGRRKWSDFAVLYRVNSLSRRIEMALIRNRIPYQVAAGVAFYERAEVKDLMAYLRLVQNPNDQAAFRRIINTPARGLGKQTQNKILRLAETQRLGLLEACAAADRIPKLSRRALLAAKRFGEMMADFSLADAGSVEALLVRIIERTGYVREWEHSRNEADLQSLANVNELVTAARQYDEAHEGTDTSSLEGFLETSSLAAEVDAIDPEAGKVTLMTLHAAKGLEFPVVFVLGIEQNLIPHERSLQDNNIRELEEERRLLFVGMTRAQHELYLTLTRMREIRGRQLDSIPSMFLSEMDLVRNSLEVPPDEDSQVPREERPAARSEALAKTFERQGRPLLTTGANLLNGHGQPVEVPQGFQVGMLVRHPREGLGRVVEVGIGGARRTVTVEFENGERASFIANKCPLQPVGTR